MIYFVLLSYRTYYYYLFLLSPFWLPPEHGTSMKLPVSLQFLNLGQSVRLLGRVISSSQDLSTYTGQNKHRINVHIHIKTHASSRIRTYDPGIQASQDSSCLRPLDMVSVEIQNITIDSVSLQRTG
jgi:hypothetical protein